MSQSVITKAFAEWKAQQAVDNKAIVLDEFIFAHIPGLDPQKPVDKEDIPAADNIVWRQKVGKAGVVNTNAVVYSVTLGADVGDFDFNWIGLANKASNTLAAVIHAPSQRKIKNASGQQGNVLTRSVLMEYSGAQKETQISVPAESWQIDFTARMAGMDEAARLAGLDIYGSGAFFDDGFLVTKSGTQYFVTRGLGYIGGLRAWLAEDQNITTSAKPGKVWADVCWHGTVTSAYKTEIKFTLADSLADYTSDGIAHYVFALASIDAAGAITDLRPLGSKSQQQGNSDFLRKDDNLAALTDKTRSRASLGLGTAATKNVGVNPGSVMRVDDFSHGCFAAEMGVRRVLTGSTPPSAPGVWAVANSSWTPLPYGGLFYTTNSGDLSVGSADGRFNNYIFIGYGSVGEPIIYFATDVNGRFSGWAKSYTTNSKPSAADVDAWSKGESNGRFAYKSITINGQPLSSNVNLTAGDVNAWNKTESDGRFVYSTGDKIQWLNVTDGLAVGKNIVAGGDLTINGQDFITKRGNYTNSDNKSRQTNAMRINGIGDLFADIFHSEEIGQYHSLGIHVANGGAQGWFSFRNDGSFYASNTVNAGNARLYKDANLSGDRWGGYLSDWLNNNTISRVMRGAQGSMTMDGGLVEAPAGCVLTGGNGNEGNQVGISLYRPLQIWRSGYWQTIEG
ncbi:phage tail-collar fiber domain-containing protein [Erwinia pyrifoliae]|uniref:phage tail-collar fiber domain-containing protein n=1 Tax=Erwinia pyrifoliae TaxID=79967 RepID=UPI002882FF5D|nr:phage tail protein [Erwinia pyrifoliae]